MMKIRNLILLLFFINCFLSCSFRSTEVVNTKWIYDFGYCQDSLEFKEDGKYSFYSCETDETVYGDYIVENEIITLEQKEGEFDQEFADGSRHKTQHLKFKLRLENEQIIYVERWELNVNSEWVKSDFKFDDSYSYKKAN